MKTLVCIEIGRYLPNEPVNPYLDLVSTGIQCRLGEKLQHKASKNGPEPSLLSVRAIENVGGENTKTISFKT